MSDNSVAIQMLPFTFQVEDKTQQGNVLYFDLWEKAGKPFVEVEEIAKLLGYSVSVQNDSPDSCVVTFTMYDPPVEDAEDAPPTVTYETAILYGVNFRSEPSGTSSIFRMLRKGEKIHVIGDLGNWLKIQSQDGVIGYISANTQYSDYKPPTVDYFAERLIKTGEKYLGIPYKFGADYGQTANFDCSSFTKTVFAENGITLPRVSRDQATKGTEVSKEEMKPGDLVFFRSANTTDPTITHVAIYCSQGDILHTYGAGGVRHTGFTGTGWENRFITARRMF